MATTKIWKVEKRLDHVIDYTTNEEKTKNEYFIYTKGDANRNPDNYKITKDMILGVVNCKIPYIGKPTVLLNEYW